MACVAPFRPANLLQKRRGTCRRRCGRTIKLIIPYDLHTYIIRWLLGVAGRGRVAVLQHPRAFGEKKAQPFVCPPSGSDIQTVLATDTP